MKLRDAAFVLIGIVVGIGGAVWMRDGDATGPEGVAPPPSPSSRHSDAVNPPANLPTTIAVAAAPPAPPPGAGNLALPIASLELRLQERLLDRAGGARAVREGKVGLHPYASMTAEELAPLRESAEKAVRPLLDKWRAAAPGAERAAAMKDLLSPLRHLLETGGSMENLLVLEESAERGESAEERRWAVIATHTLWQPEVVDFLLARTRSPRREVRLYAVEGLAWVRGSEAPRAVDGVVAGLDDGDPGVRGIAASSLAVLVADSNRVQDILDRLRTEGDADAAKSMARAVLVLDPSKGRERITAVTGSANSTVGAAIEKELGSVR